MMSTAKDVYNNTNSFADWFKKDDIPDELNLNSLTSEMINNFKNNM